MSRERSCIRFRSCSISQRLKSCSCSRICATAFSRSGPAGMYFVMASRCFSNFVLLYPKVRASSVVTSLLISSARWCASSLEGVRLCTGTDVFFHFLSCSQSHGTSPWDVRSADQPGDGADTSPMRGEVAVAIPGAGRVGEIGCRDNVSQPAPITTGEAQPRCQPE